MGGLKFLLEPLCCGMPASRGGHLPIFLVRMCGWSPQTPTHSYTRPSEKHDPFIYFSYRKLTPFIYYFWKLTPFIYYFSNFTHSYTFWVKKIPHWYTFDVKMIPIHILGGLKSIPHSSRTSVYTFIMEVTPPWPAWLQPNGDSTSTTIHVQPCQLLWPFRNCIICVLLFLRKKRHYALVEWSVPTTFMSGRLGIRCWKLIFFQLSSGK